MRRGKRAAKAKRRAVTRGRSAQSIDPVRVFDRDGWRCHLCGVKTPRELLLLKVMANVTNRAELREIAGIYKAKIIDLSPDSMVFELTGRPEKIDAFLKLMSDYQILEQCRTGVTALERGGMHQHMQKPAQEVREAQFPLPGTRCR